MYEFFVLDLDLTYDNNGDDFGVMPEVYIVDRDKVDSVLETARKARNEFHEFPEGAYEGWCIADIFEDMLTKQEIAYERIGAMPIPFKDRQGIYLSRKVEIACV